MPVHRQAVRKRVNLTVAPEVRQLLPLSFQFFTRLAAVFAEDGDDFYLLVHASFLNGPI